MAFFIIFAALAFRHAIQENTTKIKWRSPNGATELRNRFLSFEGICTRD